MSRRLSGFVTIMLAPGLEVETSESPADKTQSRTLWQLAQQACRQVAGYFTSPISEQGGEAKIFLICVDHLHNWLIPWLYTSNGSVCDVTDFKTLALDLVKKISRGTGDRAITSQSISILGGILHELFWNTHQWARFDLKGRPWRRSIRGIAAERHCWTDADIARVTDGDNSLIARTTDDNNGLITFVNFHRNATNRDDFQCYEFTVFDSGVGLVRQWMGKDWTDDIDIQDEYLACIECFKKYKSTSPRCEKGLGLTWVMEMANSLKCILFIRTGRLSLYRDFACTPLIHCVKDVVLFDVRSCATTKITPFESVYGTHFRILIPAS